MHFIYRVATKDIEKGEEIIVCHSPIGFDSKTARERHQELDFVCKCKACEFGTTFQ